MGHATPAQIYKNLMTVVNTDGDHRTHQLLPANSGFGELHCHEGAPRHPSSIGWTRLENIHGSFGSRLAQQIVRRNVNYDIEYGFQLPRRADSLEARPVTRTQGYLSIPQRMQPDHSHQLTIFVSMNKDISFGVGAQVLGLSLSSASARIQRRLIFTWVFIDVRECYGSWR